MKPSLTPVLIVIELGFVIALAYRCARESQNGESVTPVYLHIAWVAAYAIVSSILGARGVYVSDGMLETLPGLWLPLVPMLVVVTPIILSAGLRRALYRVADATRWHWFAWFHALRIGAIGTAYKTWIGEFPEYFELAVGVPDFLFGVSALWMVHRLRRGEMTRRGFLLWNALGALVIVPITPILLQLGLPGPLQLFTSQPDARAVLTFPMSIAPMIGVPLFVLINLWVVWYLWEEGKVSPAPESQQRAA